MAVPLITNNQPCVPASKLVQNAMGEMKKITVEVDAKVLASAQEFTGESIAETVRAGLRDLQHKYACRELLKLQGKVKFDYTIEELRAMDDDT